MSNAQFEFKCIRNDDQNEKWINHWNDVWPHCKKWYLSEGLLKRSGYLTCQTALKTCMPEMDPLFTILLDKVGGGDIQGRFLSLYNPPPYLAGCSQTIWNRNDLFLIKNYDYGPSMFERTLFYSNWLRPVLGILDCTWGILDGMNVDGLVVSLTFGGKKEVGEGFGAPLILRYLLETCKNVSEAKIKIKQVPCHMSYNVTLLDKSGAFTLVHLAPGKSAVFQNESISTNHQGERNLEDWPEYAEFSKSRERYNYLKNSLSEDNLEANQLVQLFLKEPLYNTNFKHFFGTLYTVIYGPIDLKLSLLWKDQSIGQSFENFIESNTLININGSE